MTCAWKLTSEWKRNVCRVFIWYHCIFWRKPLVLQLACIFCSLFLLIRNRHSQVTVILYLNDHSYVILSKEFALILYYCYVCNNNDILSYKNELHFHTVCDSLILIRDINTHIFRNIIRKMMTRFEWKRKRIKEGKSRHQRNYPKSIPKLYIHVCSMTRFPFAHHPYTHFSPSTYTKAHILQICMTIKERRWCGGTNNEKLKWKFHSHSMSTAFLEKYTETHTYIKNAYTFSI